MLKRKLTSALALTAAVTTLTAFSAMAAELPTTDEIPTDGTVKAASTISLASAKEGDGDCFYTVTIDEDQISQINAEGFELLYDENGVCYGATDGDGTVSFVPVVNMDPASNDSIELTSDAPIAATLTTAVEAD